MRVYWCRCAGNRNFGDRFTEFLLRSVGIPAVWAPPAESEMFGAGSILNKLPRGYEGVVFGSGKIREDDEPDLSRARVLGVRGKLTSPRHRHFDPVVLAARFVPPGAVREVSGVLSHYADNIEPLPHERQINVLGGVRNVIHAVARCAHLRTNSLHGVVLAETLGIPYVWVRSDKLTGGDFKFRDFFSVPISEHKKNAEEALLELQAL